MSSSESVNAALYCFCVSLLSVAQVSRTMPLTNASAFPARDQPTRKPALLSCVTPPCVPHRQPSCKVTLLKWSAFRAIDNNGFHLLAIVDYLRPETCRLNESSRRIRQIGSAV